MDLQCCDSQPPLRAHSVSTPRRLRGFGLVAGASVPAGRISRRSIDSVDSTLWKYFPIFRSQGRAATERWTGLIGIGKSGDSQAIMAMVGQKSHR